LFYFLRVYAALASLLLSACASDSIVGRVTGALYQQQFGTSRDATLTAPLNPAYRYLRVQATGGDPALLVLGYVESDPQGEILVWYSGQHEVIKTQHGRVVASAGLAQDWRNLRFPVAPPSWTAVQGKSAYKRLRDEMPGYRYGLLETIALTLADAPPPANVIAFVSPDQANRLVWYRESVDSGTSAPLPDAWFALLPTDRSRVVYSYQCLAPNLCLHLQAWPPEKGAS
jgi:hypothetical protein